MKLEKIATDRVLTVGPSDSVSEAFGLMVEHDIRHLPVVEEGEVRGIVSDRDLLMIISWISAWRSLTERSTTVGKKKVAELMSSPVSVLSPDDSVEQAVQLMLEGQFSAVPLVRDGQVLGIVTELDVLRRLADNSPDQASGAWREQRVVDHMADVVVTAEVNDHVMPSFNLMKEQRIRHLPVVEDNQLVGMISDRDLRRTHGREIAVNLAREEPDLDSTYHATIGEVMGRHVEAIDPLSTLAHAAGRMVHCKIGALPVTKQDLLHGIITETDLLKAFVCSTGG